MVAVEVHRPQTAAHALELQGVSRRFGGLVAVREVSLAIEPGERRAIIGPNGAGKTTLFNVITGELRPTTGTITFFGRDVTRLPTHQRIRLGLARTYQTPLVFPRLSVAENLYLAVRGVRPWRLSLRRPRAEDPEWTQVESLAVRIGLRHALHALAGVLSHGEQRQLELGMALASRPKLLLLDEPAAGLSPGEREQLTTLLQTLEPEVTVLLIEHDMDVAFQIAERITVLHEGSIVAEGTPEEIVSSATVQQVYLGGTR